MNRARLIVLGWIVSIALAVLIIVNQVNFSYDLGILLPSANTPSQQVLVERVGQSPGAQLIFVAVDHSHNEALNELLLAVDESPLFKRVLGGAEGAGSEKIPAVISENRYLLDDRPLEQSFVDAEFSDRARELRIFGGQRYAQMLARDPTMASVHVLQSASEFATEQSDWKTAQQETVIVVETVAAAFDIAAQRLAVDEIRSITSRVTGDDDPRIRMTGIGYIGTQLESQIRREAQTRSILASVVLLLVLMLAYRHPVPVLLTGLPLLSGGLIALAVLALVVDSVHGITLAFGFTLLGIGVDYPVHLFSHARKYSSNYAIAQIWPTLKLGVLSTMLAYLALTLTGSEGTRQLGIFTAVGLLVITVVTRFVLPVLSVAQTRSRTGATTDALAVTDPLRPKWAPLIIVSAVSLVAIGYNWSGKVFDDDLTRLSPVPAELLRIDRDIRQAAGTPDSRYLIAVRDRELQATLRATEEVDVRLKELPSDQLGGWFAVNRLLPSVETQLSRRNLLPSADSLGQWIEQASNLVGFNSQMFEQFELQVASSRARHPLVMADYDGTAFASLINSHLYQNSTDWVSIIALHGLQNPQELIQSLATTQATLVDLKQASQSLVTGYRRSIGIVVLLAVMLITVLLVWQTSPQRGIWVVAAAAIAVVGAVATVYSFFGPLDLYHLMAMLLVAGLVLDYGLFLSRSEATQQSTVDSEHAVITCAVTTTATFAILAFSSIPALRSLGTMVSLGALIGFTITWLSTRGISVLKSD